MAGSKQEPLGLIQLTARLLETFPRTPGPELGFFPSVLLLGSAPAVPPFGQGRAGCRGPGHTGVGPGANVLMGTEEGKTLGTPTKASLRFRPLHWHPGYKGTWGPSAMGGGLVGLQKHLGASHLPAPGHYLTSTQEPTNIFRCLSTLAKLGLHCFSSTGFQRAGGLGTAEVFIWLEPRCWLHSDLGCGTATLCPCCAQLRSKD